ncbi:endo-1,4-beta-xylanase [Paludibacter jiangxiensis]|uniref:Beta-xylanase n=1 Tax=Paludibacter jiangxiensis TaxID=681398 RepID=A0A171A9U1_9BACT|nr:endo-1,4-beta-xylanase [Paludibacter jiangxiensis]GAT63430.1 endo-1,4-beta-xylanase [Paludibacter jiangxiensis]
MMRKLFMAGFILIETLAVSGYSQDNTLSQKTLKQAFADKFLIGCADDLTSNNEAYQASIKAQYDIVTPENCMKPQPIHPSENTYNFKTTDAMVDWCQKNGLKVWGHTLGWHSQTPAWFFQAVNPKTEEAQPARGPRMSFDPKAPRLSMDEMWARSIKGEMASKKVALKRLEKHIKTVVGRYKGRIIGWDVFNESIADGGDGSTENLRTFSWYKVVGPEVLTKAFQWAHQADPKAKLYYNDYNIEQGAVENKGKHASSMLLLKRLLKEGAPITGVGIQGHWHLDTNLADVEKAIEDYASLGLKVSITELDVTATGENSGAFSVNQGAKKIPAENYIKQAEVYKKLFEIFMRHSDVIERVTFWGLSDTRSWRRGQDALLFDGQLNPKPAYKAVIETSQTK